MTDSVLIAHRGLEDTLPENTLLAFEGALRLGMGFEFDLQMTADSKLVVIHDETVNRTTDGGGRVDKKSLDELRELDAGAWKDEKFAGEKIPKFEEVLELVLGYSDIEPAMLLDIRRLPPGIINMVCNELISRDLLDRTVGIGVIAQSVDVRRRFYEGSPQFLCSALAQSSESLPMALNDPYSNWIYARFVPTAADVAMVRNIGKKMVVSGDAVSADVEEALAATGANPDAVLTWHPTELHNRLNG